MPPPRCAGGSKPGICVGVLHTSNGYPKMHALPTSQPLGSSHSASTTLGTSDYLAAASCAVLTTTTFLALAIGLTSPFLAIFGVPYEINLALMAMNALAGLWIATWSFSRSIEVERRLAQGQEPGEPSWHIRAPWRQPD